MEKIINAKQAAKDTIASELKSEILRINECISEAKEKGKNNCTYTVNGKSELLSEASRALLKRVGYKVLLEVSEKPDAEDVFNIISWEKEYKKALRDKRNFEDFLGVAGDRTSDH